MRAIIAKELRELVRILPIGLLLIGLCTWFIAPRDFGLNWPRSGRFVVLPFGASLLAVLLATLQGWFDFSDRQRGLLFHRARSEAQILFGKVTAGFIVFAFCLFVPLVALALWIGVYGRTYFPADVAEVVPVALGCFGCFALHPATLLALRQAGSWIGTRTYPVVVVGAAVVFLCVAIPIQEPVMTALAWVLWFVLVAFVLFALARTIWAVRILLGLAALVLFFIGLLLGASVIESTASPNTLARVYAFDEHGDIWFYKYRTGYSRDSYEPTTEYVSGDRVAPDREPDLEATLPANFAPRAFNSLCSFEPQPRIGIYSQLVYTPRSVIFSKNDGEVLIYDPQSDPPFRGEVSKLGFHKPGEPTGPRFRGDAPATGSLLSNVLSSSGYQGLWADADGVYQFDAQTGKIQFVVEQPAKAGVLLTGPTAEGEKTLVMLALLTDAGLQIYELQDGDQGGTWFEPRNLQIQRKSLPKLRATLVRTTPPLPKAFELTGAQVGLTPDGTLLLLDGYTRYQVLSLENQADAVWKLEPFVAPRLTQPPTLALCGWWTLAPLGMWMILFSIAVLIAVAKGRPLPTPHGTEEYLPVMIAIGLVVLLVSMIITNLLCRKRGLSVAGRRAWTIAATFLGLAAPWMVLAIYPRLNRVRCAHCGKPRRVDQVLCEHCQAKWEPETREGIEILESDVEFAQRDRTPQLV